MRSTPSITAMRVAMRRAAHQLYDSPLILNDPVVLSILGTERCDKLRSDPARQSTPIAVAMRAYMAVRARFAEDCIAAAVANGTTQLVILGAGLDTFAHRNPHPTLRVFEVDHPATQSWKLDMLAAAALPHPPNLRYAAVDFEARAASDSPASLAPTASSNPEPAPQHDLRTALLAAGLDHTAKTFFSWMGVVPYLTLPAFRATLAFAASLPIGSGIAFDYGLPREHLSPRARIGFDYLASRVRRAGEPFQLFFTPAEAAAELRAAHYTRIQDLAPADLNARYFTHNASEQDSVKSSPLTLRPEAGHHIVCAWSCANGE